MNKREYTEKTKGAIKIAKQIEEESKIDFNGELEGELSGQNKREAKLARAYESAAIRCVGIGDLKKAEKYFLMAAKEYGKLFNRLIDEEERDHYRHLCFKNMKNLEKIRKIRNAGLRGIEGRIAKVVSIIGIVSGILLIGKDATISGNAVGAYGQMSVTGAAFFCIGLLGAFAYLRLRNA